MTSTKLIVVLGATGNQGGSVVDTFVKESSWRVRAITRNSTSAKAQSLIARGAEVVQADMDVPSTLVSAFEGANAIFAVSDFWGLYGDPANKSKPQPSEPLNVWVGNQETQQLKNVIDAAAKVQTLERFVISSLSNATKWSQGKYLHVYHFDSKANAEEYAKQTYPELWAKTSVFQAGLFLSNFTGSPFMTPKLNANGVAQFFGNLDVDVKLPFIAAEEDSGPLVKALVQETAGKNLIGYREWLTLKQFTEAFTRTTGIKSEPVVLPIEEFISSFPEDLKLEIADMFAYFKEFGYEARDDPTVIHPREVRYLTFHTANIGTLALLTSPPELASVVDYIGKQEWSKVLNA